MGSSSERNSTVPTCVEEQVRSEKEVSQKQETGRHETGSKSCSPMAACWVQADVHALHRCWSMAWLLAMRCGCGWLAATACGRAAVAACTRHVRRAAHRGGGQHGREEEVVARRYAYDIVGVRIDDLNTYNYIA
jgi:hypothetical protein